MKPLFSQVTVETMGVSVHQPGCTQACGLCPEQGHPTAGVVGSRTQPALPCQVIILGDLENALLICCPNGVPFCDPSA